MARRPAIDRKAYGILLNAFRDGAKPAVAARAAGCSWRIAKRALEHGWPSLEWARPIRQVLDDEKVHGRAERYAAALTSPPPPDQELLPAARVVAALDAAQVRSIEGEGIGASLRSVVGLLQRVERLVDRLDPLLRTIEEKFDAGLDFKDAVTMLGFLSRLIGRLNEAMLVAMKAERTWLGTPGEIVGYVEMSPEEARERVRRANEAIDKVEARMRLIQGGKASG